MCFAITRPIMAFQGSPLTLNAVSLLTSTLLSSLKTVRTVLFTSENGKTLCRNVGQVAWLG